MLCEFEDFTVISDVINRFFYEFSKFLNILEFLRILNSEATNSQTMVFKLDALALSVIATARWLSGWVARWLAGWLSHSGIVSKPLNLSENFFDHLKAPSL